jgi:succinate dehydrogenase/fumarate reductase cytochrome b subunit
MLAVVAARRALVAAPCATASTMVPRTLRRTASTAARPLSPHLTIYKFRVNMITSVVFRGTGIAMTGGEYESPAEAATREDRHKTGLTTFFPPSAPPIISRARAGIALLAVTALFAKRDYKYYVYQLQQYPLLNAIVKFGVAFPLSYHYLGGLRHLVSVLSCWRELCAPRA